MIGCGRGKPKDSAAHRTMVPSNAASIVAEWKRQEGWSAVFGDFTADQTADGGPHGGTAP
jgi:hypothetical protein